MANSLVKHIKVNNTTYDICDEVARQGVQGFTKVGSVTNSTQLNLPSGWKELYCVVTSVGSTTAFPCVITRGAVDEGKTSFEFGTYVSSGNNTGIAIQCTTSKINISTFYHNGTSILDNSRQLIVWSR